MGSIKRHAASQLAWPGPGCEGLYLEHIDVCFVILFAGLDMWLVTIRPGKGELGLIRAVLFLFAGVDMRVVIFGPRRMELGLLCDAICLEAVRCIQDITWEV
mgnify:CR=1 FL=1